VPIKRVGDAWTILCINGCVDHTQPDVTVGAEVTEVSSMQMAIGWNALMVAKPPHPGPLPPIVAALLSHQRGPFGTRLDPSTAAPVRMYICSVCGYVELYHGPTLYPKAWGNEEMILSEENRK
jgi:hypothetical protein